METTVETTIKTIGETIPTDIQKVFEHNNQRVGIADIDKWEHYTIIILEGTTTTGHNAPINIEIDHKHWLEPTEWSLAFHSALTTGDFDPWKEAHLYLDENGDVEPEHKNDYPYLSGEDIYEAMKYYLDTVLDNIDSNLYWLVEHYDTLEKEGEDWIEY